MIPEIAIRLADEGVPLRAIARAIRMSSNLVRERLQAAQTAGRLLDLPHDDWPPGFPRDQRALQLSRMVVENREVVLLAVQQVFHLTPTGAGLLLALVQHPSVHKGRLSGALSVKAVDVYICYVRKQLERFEIKITTLWGFGYQLDVANRRRTMDLILREVSPQPDWVEPAA